MANFINGADAIQGRHAQVKQCDVGPVLLPEINRFTAIGGFAHYQHVSLPSDHCGQSLADRHMIVGDQNANSIRDCVLLSYFGRHTHGT